MPGRKAPYLLFFSFLLLFSCDTWDLEQQDFPELEITDFDSLSIDSVRISGRMEGLAVGQASEHGFLWSNQTTEPDIFFNEGQYPLGAKTKGDGPSFSAVLGLAPNTTYTFRAYATLDGAEYVYSSSREYRTGNAQVFTTGLEYYGGFGLELSGRLSGTEKGIVASQHGFCWSAANPQPTLEDEFENLGDRRDNGIFTFTFGRLQDDTPFYFRTFAILSFNFKQDTVYGQVLPFDGNLNFWVKKENLIGTRREVAVGFSIGQKGYIGTGWSGWPRADFWEYDPQTDSWAQKADFGGGLRELATGFSIGAKGYIGTGADEDGQQKADFWEYDPQTNSWAQKADFGGGAREDAVGFSIGDKGYVGTGWGGQRKRDFWEFDPEDDADGLDENGNPIGKWRPKADFGGGRRERAVGFSIGNKGYIGVGSSSQFKQDFWEYDPLTDSWVQKADFGGGPREYAVGFSIGPKGYIGTGRDENEASGKDFWEFDPGDGADGLDEKGNPIGKWRRKADFGGGERNGAVGFAIGQKGYIGTGLGSGTDGNLDFQRDFWVWED